QRKTTQGSKAEENNLERNPIRLSVDFSTETLEARREWNDIFKTLKDKSLQPRILYPAKISFRFEGEVKSFPDKQKLRDFVAKRPPLQEIPKKAAISEKRKKGERGHKPRSRETNR
uniref:L1 transposable element dsRBD-like domain-containing protein n=1 Tax=Equus caballus TaxID=9796 RepID=A0A9L0RXB0_HORSE